MKTELTEIEITNIEIIVAVPSYLLEVIEGVIISMNIFS